MKEKLARGRTKRVRSLVTQFSSRSAGLITLGLRRYAPAALCLVFLLPSVAGASVQALFNVSTVGQAPFPSDEFTVPDPTNITQLKISLPLPDCTIRPSDCNDLGVINTLDGFNVNARVSIPFNGPIDPNTATSDNVFLVNLRKPHKKDGGVVGINQVVWDPTTNTLHAKPDQLLEQDTPYALVVTDGVHDSGGNPVQPSAAFAALFDGDFDVSQAYLVKLAEALDDLSNGNVGEKQLSDHIVVASVFTTQSVTAILEKIRRQISETTPAPANFLLGPGGARTVFSLADITGVTLSLETGTAPSFTATNFTPFLASLKLIPNVVGRLAFGTYSSPDYEVHPGEFIPPVGTLTGVPVVQRTNDVEFLLVVPSGPKPKGGWPVAIFGHGSGSADVVAFFVAAKMAEHGVATICIQAVGHGFGPLGTVTVTQSAGSPVTFPYGGRGIDQDANGTITSTEGFATFGSQNIIATTDGLRQTVVDLLQLVRVIQVGMDVDGDGSSILDPSRIYYFGQSLGGFYGTVFLGVEPDVLVGVPNVAGGPFVDVNRLSPFNRPAQGASLAARVPSLINLAGINFNENLPLRDQPPLINTVAGADAIQELFDRREWVSEPGNPVAYARYIRKEPLDGVPEKSTIFQNARGDEQVPNPTSAALLRAGELADVATFYRTDLALAADPSVPKTPHLFLTRVPPLSSEPLANAIALDAQEQIATFFESGGDTIINPDPNFFEVPIVPPPPETCNYLFTLPPGFFPGC